MSQICAHFWFLKMGFWSEKWVWGKTGGEFWSSLEPDSDDFARISAHLPTFCPLLKHGFGHKFDDLTIEKPSIYAGLRVLAI